MFTPRRSYTTYLFFPLSFPLPSGKDQPLQPKIAAAPAMAAVLVLKEALDPCSR
jgi:hypothetical protein